MTKARTILSLIAAAIAFVFAALALIAEILSIIDCVSHHEYEWQKATVRIEQHI